MKRANVAAAVKRGTEQCPYLDLATDIDLGQKRANDAINRLKNARDLRVNPVLQLNLANAYLREASRKRRKPF